MGLSRKKNFIFHIKINFSTWYGRYAIEELSKLATWKRETNLNSCENIEKICGPGFPKSAVQKILHHPTLSGERSNWISTFYSGVDTNAFISSPIIFSSKFPSLISSTRRLDHFSPSDTHSPFFDFQKLSPPTFAFNSLKITPLRANSKIFSKKPQLTPGWL